MRFAGFATYILMIVLPGLAAAQANDPILPPPDPPGMWRKLTHDDATTTSRCIGNPVTPLCAVETFIACFLHRRPDLCDLVQAGVQPLASVPKAPHKWEEYRVLYARRPSPLDPVDPATEGDMNPQAGDVVIGLLRRACFERHDREPNCTLNVEKNPPYVYMLRKQGDIWVHVYRFRARF